MNYYELEFDLNPVLPAREVLIAELAEKGFESFVETDHGLKAYIGEPSFDDFLLKNLMTIEIPDLKYSFVKTLIPDRNWNEEWEKNFDPIIVNDQCLIKAPFHTDLPKFEFEILIEPKMSFGTGHHATTHLIIEKMLKMEFENMIVLDMGCGTGVLAILAEMKGASSIDAIDIDDWAFENTIENIERNKCKQIKVIQGGAEFIPTIAVYDIILANINRNILTNDMSHYVQHMKSGSQILFSGFYTSDIPELEEVARGLGLLRQDLNSRGEWCMLHYTLQ